MIKNAKLIGTVGGYELLERYVPHGRFSKRAIIFLFVKPAASPAMTFAQMSSVRREIVADFSDERIATMLRHDAVSRAKQHIQEESFQPGEVYTSSLEAVDVEVAA